MGRSSRTGVTVVIPAYNGAKFVCEAIRSVFLQTRLPDELIVVDDASTDATAELVAALAGEAPCPLRLIQLASNSGGPVRPTNVGVQAARSRYIAVLDQDDVFVPQRIDEQSALLEEHPHLSVVFGFHGEYGRSSRAVLRNSEKQRRDLPPRVASYNGIVFFDGAVALRSLVVRGNYVGGFPAFTFRRADWEQLGGIDEKLAAAADYDFLCCLCQKGRVALVPEIHYLRRIHEENLSRRRARCHVDVIRTLSKYAHCNAWPTAARDVRYAIGKNLYHLAVNAGVAGHDHLAKQLLKGSLFVGGGRPSDLLRHLGYTLKVVRRKRRNCNTGINENEMALCVSALETTLRLYDQRWRGWEIPDEAQRDAA